MVSLIKMNDLGEVSVYYTLFLFLLIKGLSKRYFCYYYHFSQYLRLFSNSLSVKMGKLVATLIAIELSLQDKRSGRSGKYGNIFFE